MAPVHCVSSQGGASAGPCDVSRDNAQITSLFRSFAINAWEDARLTEATLRSELTLGKLVGVHISWGGASGHMLLIYGCKGATMFSVYDPCLGAESYTYSEIVNYGDGEGTWDLTWRDL